MRVIKTQVNNPKLNQLLVSSPNNNRDNITRFSAPAGSKLALPTMEGIQFEKTADIVCLLAKGNYTSIHFMGGKKILVCKTLMEVETMINKPNQFIRIHRSSTINLERIQKYIKGKGGYVEMETGATVNVSVGKKQAFMHALKTFFC